MDEIDEIISVLEDGEWHPFEDLRKTSQVPVTELWWIIRFLQKFDFLEMDEERNKTKLTKSFLNLPLVNCRNRKETGFFPN